MYGGDGGSDECRYELIRCTKVDLPAPAIPIVIMAMGFFLPVVAWSIIEVAVYVLAWLWLWPGTRASTR